MFFFFLTGYRTKVKEVGLPYYLPIVEKKVIGFLHFAIALCEK